MTENKSQVAPNSDGNGQITIINVGYCSKCLRVLDGNDDVVRDNEGNLFCCESCRSDYWREIRREFENIMGY